MSDSSSPEITELKAECAALRGTLALLVSGLHGKHDHGSTSDWQDGTMERLAAGLTGHSGNPDFAAAFERLRSAVLSFKSEAR